MMEFLQENWPWVATALGAVGIVSKNTVTANNARTSASKAHERVDETRQAVSDIRECVARIETHYKHTKESIDEIKRRLDDGKAQP